MKQCRGLGVGNVLVALALAELGVEQEFIAAVHREQAGAAVGVDGPVGPRLRMRDRVVDLAAAEIERGHRTAHEVALGGAFADEGQAERLADRAAGAVRAHGVGGTEAAALVAVAALCVHGDTVGILLHGDRPPAEADRNAGLRGRLGAQHVLDIHLRHPVRQLGRAPRSGQRADHVGGGAGRGQLEPRQFVGGEAGEIGDVGRIVGRQAHAAQLVGEAEPAVVLHGAGLGGVGGREPHRRGFLVEHDDGNAAPSEFDREHQPARPRADDDNRAILLPAHVFPRLAPRPL